MPIKNTNKTKLTCEIPIREMARISLILLEARTLVRDDNLSKKERIRHLANVTWAIDLLDYYGYNLGQKPEYPNIPIENRPPRREHCSNTCKTQT